MGGKAPLKIVLAIYYVKCDLQEGRIKHTRKNGPSKVTKSFKLKKKRPMKQKMKGITA